MTDKPIIVGDSAIPSMIATAVRAVLAPFLATLATQGVVSGDQGEALLNGLAVGAVVVWQIYVSWSKHRKLKVTAEAAPNAIAQVR